jgi:hypothetical protein
MDKCAEVWFGKQNVLYGAFHYVLSMAPLLIGIAVGFATYKITFRIAFKEKVVRVNATTLEPETNTPNPDEPVDPNAAPSDEEIKKYNVIHYRYEYKGQTFQHQKTLPYYGDPVKAGETITIFIKAKNPDVEISGSTYQITHMIALVLAILLGCGTINVFLAIGSSFCK